MLCLWLNCCKGVTLWDEEQALQVSFLHLFSDMSLSFACDSNFSEGGSR
jgi:hypothetical protein